MYVWNAACDSLFRSLLLEVDFVKKGSSGTPNNHLEYHDKGDTKTAS